jgi:epoxyqueuosine reductase
MAKADDFDLGRLLHMDKEYFESRIWPHMFYMSYNDIWRWKMNVARAMGNSLDSKYIPELVRAFRENEDERIKSMSAWALGRLGGTAARDVLSEFLKDSKGTLRDEIINALELYSIPTPT